MKGILKDIRELFWPMLDPAEDKPERPLEDPEEVLRSLKDAEGETIQSVLDSARSAYSSEDSRLAAIESKAAAMVGFNGIVVALVTTLLAWAAGEPGTGLSLHWVEATFIMVAVVYFATSIWFALKALQRAAYETVTVEDVIEGKLADGAIYKKSLIAKYITSAISNYDVINNKVDNTVMAQEFSKRGFIALILLAVWIVGNSMLPYAQDATVSLLERICGI